MNALIEGEQGAWGAQWRHPALPGVSGKPSRDPEPELGLEPEEEEKEGLSKRRSLKGKGTEL